MLENKSGSELFPTGHSGITLSDMLCGKVAITMYAMHLAALATVRLSGASQEAGTCPRDVHMLGSALRRVV